MPRKAKGIHTSPDKAGEHNMPEDYKDKPKNQDDLNTMQKILPIRDHGRHVLETYKGKWTDEDLDREVGEYFKYCADNSLKPAKAGLRIWLSVSRSQYNDWELKPEKYGRKSEIILNANDAMELSYIERMESYPTGNIFLLKSSHGHIETSKMDVTTNNQVNTSAEEVKDLVKQLGLNKSNT